MTARDEETGALATDNITVLANLPPVGGALEVTPSRGYVHIKFSLYSYGWTDPDGDSSLIHRFEYLSSLGLSVSLGDSIGAPSSNATSDTRLPGGNNSLRVVVTDSFGGEGIATCEGVVALVDLQGTVAAVQHLTSEIESLIAEGDGPGAMSLVSIGAQTLASGNNEHGEYARMRHALLTLA